MRRGGNGRAAALALALVALMLAPSALAGTERQPDVVDNPEEFTADRDLLAAWAENGPSGLHVTLKIEGASRPPPDLGYAFVFALEGRRYAPSVAADPEGRLRSLWAMTNYDAQGIEGPETFHDALRDVEFEPGTPAYVRFVIPWGIHPAFDEGTTISSIGAATTRYVRERADWVDVDLALTDRSFALERTLLTPDLRAALPWIGGIVGALLLGSAGAFVYVHRKERARDGDADAPDEAPR